MRILVTGANGFVGRHLCLHLTMCGHQCVRSVRVNDGLPDTFVLDESTPDDLMRLAMAGVECVIHLAAKVHVLARKSSAIDAEYYSTNVLWPLRLAAAAKRAGVRRFVFASSIGVIGNDSGDLAYTEAREPDPQSSYAISKLKAEIQLQGMESAAPELVIVRPVIVYGEGVRANFLSLLRAVDREVPLPMKSLTNRRSFLYVGNLVSALEACATHPAAAGKVFNLADDPPVLVSDLVIRLSELMGRRARLFPCPAWFLEWIGRVMGQGHRVGSVLHDLSVDASKIKDELAWRPPYSMAEGLQRTVAWFLRQAS